MRFARLAAIAFAIAVLFTGLLSNAPALAQDGPEATQIELSTSPAVDDQGNPVIGRYVITAVLTTAEGKNVGRGVVTFVENVNFFGQRATTLGTDVTDRKGTAEVTYQPAQAGEHTILASFAGDEKYAASEEQFLFVPTDVVPPFVEESLPLGSVSQWLSISLAVLGVVFWVVLLGVLFRTVRQIRTAGKAQAGSAAS